MTDGISMAPALQGICLGCGTSLCETAHGSPVCPRCELAGALGEEAGPGFAGAFGDYDLDSLIAHGGMGAVYRARHRETGQLVALKTLLAGRLANSQMRERFLREANLTAKLRHPHIVPVLEAGEAEGLPYLVLELVTGKNLSDLVRVGPLPPREAARLVAKAAEAVAYAHGEGVLHRDLKPANILLDEAGEPRVSDFGLARTMDPQATELTVTGQVLGSPGYLAPERVPRPGQAEDDQDPQAGIASDIYSLGATLYHLLTGRPPFLGGSLEAVLMQVENTEPISLRKLNPSVPPALEAVCLKCLEKNPRRRYSGAGDLAKELQQYLSGKPVQARLPGAAARSWRWCRRRPVVASLSVGVLILLVAVVGVSVVAALRIQRDEDRLRAQLAESLLAQARAENRSKMAGRRDLALVALHQAATIRPTLELRNQAIAALTRPDLPARGANAVPRGITPDTPFSVDPEGRHFIYVSGSQLHFQRLTDGGVEKKLEAPNGPPITTANLAFGGGPRRWLLTSTPANTVTVWDVMNDRVTWQSIPQPVIPLAALTPVADELFFSSDRSLLEHVDLLTGRAVNAGTLPPEVLALKISPNGQRLAALCKSNFWVTGLPNLDWRGPWPMPGRIVEAAFAPNSEKLVCALDDFSLQVWDNEGNRASARLHGHNNEIVGMAFEDSSRWLASVSYDGTTRLWDLFSEDLELVSIRTGTRLRWHGDRDQFSLRQGGTNGLAWLDFQRPPAMLALAPRFINRAAVLVPPALSGNGRVLVATTEDLVNLLDMRTGRILTTLNTPAKGRVVATFEPEDRALLCGSSSGLLRWPLKWADDGSIEVGSREVLLPDITCSALAVDPTGRWLAVAENDRASTSGTSEMRRIWLRAPDGTWRQIPQGAAGTRLAFSPNGRWLAGGSFKENWLRVWDTSTGELKREFKGSGGVTPGFTPAGRLYAATSSGLVFWDLDSGALLRSVPTEVRGGLRGSVAFSGDGKFLALAGSRTRVDLLDADTLEVLASFDSLDNESQVLALDEHATQLVIGKKRQFYERWDLRTLRAELAKLKLDWHLPPLPQEPQAHGKPLRVVLKP